MNLLGVTPGLVVIVYVTGKLSVGPTAYEGGVMRKDWTRGCCTVMGADDDEGIGPVRGVGVS